MQLITLLSKHLTDAANIQESNRIFEGTPAIRNSDKKTPLIKNDGADK
jgi:hypothetical protein